MTAAAIYLVANRRSERDCANLVHSIRASGCKLDIVLIPFDAKGVISPSLLSEVVVMPPRDFPTEGRQFAESLRSVLGYCPEGFLRRFLAFFGPYQRFIYSDNDVVALCDWTELVGYLDEYDLVHADEEYTTGGRFNFRSPGVCEAAFGKGSLERALTAGHFAARRSAIFPDSMRNAVEWMRANADACYLQDQTMMHIAALIGNWRCLNLCKPPNNWLSSWAGDYKNTLEVIQRIQHGRRISHLHYSGGPTGRLTRAIDELQLSTLGGRARLKALTLAGACELSGLNMTRTLMGKFKRKSRQLFRSS